MYCKYYQAKVLRNKVWYFTGILRSFDHLVFDRTFDKEHSIFEFFVPQDLEHFFLDLMYYFQEKEIVSDLKNLPNRIEEKI